MRIHQLINAVQKLQKDWRKFPLVAALLVLALAVAASGVEWMAEGEKILFDEGAKSLPRSVVWI
jgi:hypothetical protein